MRGLPFWRRSASSTRFLLVLERRASLVWRRSRAREQVRAGRSRAAVSGRSRSTATGAVAAAAAAAAAARRCRRPRAPAPIRARSRAQPPVRCRSPRHEYGRTGRRPQGAASPSVAISGGVPISGVSGTSRAGFGGVRPRAPAQACRPDAVASVDALRRASAASNTGARRRVPTIRRAPRMRSRQRRDAARLRSRRRRAAGAATARSAPRPPRARRWRRGTCASPPCTRRADGRGRPELGHLRLQQPAPMGEISEHPFAALRAPRRPSRDHESLRPRARPRSASPPRAGAPARAGLRRASVSAAIVSASRALRAEQLGGVGATRSASSWASPRSLAAVSSARARMSLAASRALRNSFVVSSPSASSMAPSSSGAASSGALRRFELALEFVDAIVRARQLVSDALQETAHLRFVEAAERAREGPRADVLGRQPNGTRHRASTIRIPPWSLPVGTTRVRL